LRAILDANVFLSYVTSMDQLNRTIAQVVSAAFDGRYSLILPAELLTEIVNIASTKPFFRERVPPPKLAAFFDALIEIAEMVEPLSIDPEPVVRDEKDDYLLAAGHLYEIDVLVSGDKDLLVLRDTVTAFQILSPHEFLALIEG
jgi:putative PIN family toxin of toxin-antitoxin system